MILENLSNANLRPANSSRNSLYLSSAAEVHFDAKPTGWRRHTEELFGRVVSCHCDRTPAKPVMQPSAVTTNGELSYRGLRSTGSEVSAIFKSRKASFASFNSFVHFLTSERLYIALW